MLHEPPQSHANELPEMSDTTNPSSNAITIGDAQSLVDNWIKTVGVRYFSELTNTAVLMEEVGEVARIMARRYGEQSEKESDKNKLCLF